MIGLLKYEQLTKQQGTSIDVRTSEAPASDERPVHYLHTTPNWGNYDCQDPKNANNPISKTALEWQRFRSRIKK